MLKIKPDGGYKFIRSLNSDNTVILAERKADSSKCVLRELGADSLDLYRKILKNPHENVEAVKEIRRRGNSYIAVCEFCEGATLRELMDTNDPIIRCGIAQISEQLCDAARHFYELELVHRDITPNNIIVDYRGCDKKLDLKLIDFDISRRHYGNKPHDTTLYGTVGYAAPEQYGLGETDFLTDIYAVGRVIGDMMKICGYPPEFLEMWEYVNQKCTMYSPKDRYKSYELMKKDIAKIWRYNKAMMAAALGEYKSALKIFFRRDKSGNHEIEDDFLTISE